MKGKGKLSSPRAMCRFFRQGFCWRGAECTFVHDSVRQPSNPSSQGGKGLVRTAEPQASSLSTDALREEAPEVATGLCKAIACGRETTYILRSDGRVVAFGMDTLGQLNVPKGVFTSISSGADFAAALTADGDLHVWGVSSDGQGSVPELEPEEKFHLVTCGFDHVLAVTTEKRLVMWGKRDHSQCLAPQLPKGEWFVHLAAGDRHSLGLTNRKRCLAWGSNDWRQCWVPDLKEDEFFVQLCAGKSLSLGVTDRGRILVWGRCDENQDKVPRLPQGEKFRCASVRLDHVLATTNYGRIVGWGWNSHNCLFAPQLPAGETWVAASAGDFHSVGLTSTGRVLAWGWDTSGQVQSYMDTEEIPSATRTATPPRAPAPEPPATAPQMNRAPLAWRPTPATAPQMNRAPLAWRPTLPRSERALPPAAPQPAQGGWATAPPKAGPPLPVGVLPQQPTQSFSVGSEHPPAPPAAAAPACRASPTPQAKPPLPVGPQPQQVGRVSPLPQAEQAPPVGPLPGAAEPAPQPTGPAAAPPPPLSRSGSFRASQPEEKGPAAQRASAKSIEQRYEGVIAKFFPDKGYGFILCETLPLKDSNLHFHINACSNWKQEFRTSERVSFTFARSSKGMPQALALGPPAPQGPSAAESQGPCPAAASTAALTSWAAAHTQLSPPQGQWTPLPQLLTPLPLMWSGPSALQGPMDNLQGQNPWPAAGSTAGPASLAQWQPPPQLLTPLPPMGLGPQALQGPMGGPQGNADQSQGPLPAAGSTAAQWQLPLQLLTPLPPMGLGPLALQGPRESFQGQTWPAPANAAAPSFLAAAHPPLLPPQSQWPPPPQLLPLQPPMWRPQQAAWPCAEGPGIGPSPLQASPSGFMPMGIPNNFQAQITMQLVQPQLVPFAAVPWPLQAGQLAPLPQDAGCAPGCHGNGTEPLSNQQGPAQDCGRWNRSSQRGSPP